MKTTEIITSLCTEPIARMGYELVDVEFQKEHGDWVLVLFIDKQGGVTIEDCEAVSRAVDPIIEEADPIVQAYFLSVSSPGIDRPFKKQRDYERNIGNTIIIKLYAKLDNKKEFQGTLCECKQDGICIECNDGKKRSFLFADIAQAKPYIEF